MDLKIIFHEDCCWSDMSCRERGENCQEEIGLIRGRREIQGWNM